MAMKAFHMLKLTQRTVKSTDIKKSLHLLFDRDLSGFFLRVSPTGKRYYHVQYIRGTKVKRIKLRQHVIIAPDQAKTKAMDATLVL